MKRMLTFIAVLLVFCVFAFAVNAENADDIIKRHLEGSGALDSYEQIPDKTADEIEKYFDKELTVENVESFLDFKKFLNYILKSFFKVFKNEAVILGVIVSIILLNKFFKSICSTYFSTTTQYIVDIACVLTLVVSVSVNVTSAASEISKMIEQITTFTQALMPVMATLTASSGEVASSAVVSVFLFMGCQICAYIASHLLLPLVNIYFACVIFESLILDVNFSAIGNLIKKIISIAMGTLLTGFIAMMSLQSVLSGAGDTLAKRGVKFAVGALLPVASGMLSEAMESVFSCANVARSMTGVFGIVVIIFIVITPVLLVLSKYLLFKFSAFAGTILSEGKITAFLEGCSGVFALLLALTMVCCIILISAFTLVVITIPK
ncbi:MAG: hypothetical protein E7480_01955 [Ruminococcaceae bacterium]|nr:hypothetical protein [Oscillospiraceae bacterium]